MRRPTDFFAGSTGDAALDLALTDGMLAAGREALRIYRPARAVAFGRIDARAPGFAAAAQSARGHGFDPVLRTVGGHAAAFDAGSVVIEHVTPTRPADLELRYTQASWRMTAMLRRLGADDARVGELPGEYCPGRFSVHLGARAKVVGIAQRVTARAALVSTVVVVEDGEPLRACLVDVYAALGLALDPATVGAVAEHVPGVSAAALADAARDIYAESLDLRPADVAGLAAPDAARHRVTV